MYEWLMLGHVLFAIVWMGGAIYAEALTANAKRRKDPIALGVLFRDTAAMNQRIYVFSGFMVLFFGIWLLVPTTYRLRDLWVALALLSVGIAVTMDLIWTAPRIREGLALIDERGPGDADARAAIDQVINAGHVRLGILVFVLLLMIFKPVM